MRASGGGGIVEDDPEPDPAPDPDPPTTTSRDLRITTGGSSSSTSSSTSSSSGGSSSSSTSSAETTVVDDTSSTDSNDSSSSDEEVYTTMNDDPFSGGKTGSEVLAEAGDPASVVTSDPHASSLEDKIEQDGLAATVGTFTDLAQDGDDSNDGATFDQIPDTDAGRETLQNTANTFVEAAQNVADSATGNSNEQAQNPVQGVQQAFGEADGLGKGLLMALAVAFAFGLLAVAGGS